MNIDVVNHGDVRVMRDREDTYVTIDGETRRFGMYAMAEVRHQLTMDVPPAHAYRNVFESML